MRMKRGVALLLSIAMCFSVLSGCGNQTGSAVKLESVVENSTESTDKVVLSDATSIEANENVEKYDEYFEATEEDVKVGVNFIAGSDGQETESSDDVISSLIDKNLNGEKEEDTKAELDQPFDLAYPDVFNSDAVEFADNAILLKLKDTYSEKTAEGLKNSGVGKMEVMFEVDGYVWYTAYLLKDVDVKEAMAKVREVSGVKTAEYNFKYETASEIEEVEEVDLSSNPRYSDQWPVNKIGIQESWNHLQKETGSAGGSSSVVVAVIDTGVDYTHPDLKSNMWVNVNEIPDNNCDDDGNGYVDDYYGVNMTRDSYYEADPGTASGMDDNGHGTHVAGIIAATNNDIGMVGYAYNAKIMAIKAGDASGYFLQNNVAEAILYAYDHGADVINMSFGGSAASIAVQDALAVAYSRCVLVASAGNDGMPNQATQYYLPAPNYPAALSYVIGVMSVDQRMTESTFSNWDVALYNNVEYEVYAPGEQIISTLPGERYGMLSGTSMAAPIVAAQAALLRSCYSDTNTYPTKFIYGQIVSTADKCVTCLDPEKHLKHNIPGVVNFYNSLTYLPTPDVGMSDYTIFDTAGYVADTEGLTEGCNEINNGDGIIDAGETIALGFTLRNRWGMSENTTVHIDATSSLGVDNPYVTFLNNDINYKSIGTYSENDCGKLFSEDGEYWNGWENPFYIQVAKNCPNDYSVTLNVTITCENALDPGDDTVYETKESIMFTVRRGQVLPNRLSEDMTLTKDNYYIIPNSMIIMEGATLTVEEGTHIQFWCSDPSDSYADTAITYLKVAGTLICKGTEDEPVEMFPSGWMDKYRVEIYTSDNGKVYMEHTNVVNPHLTITEAKNCTFSQNYKDYLYYRYLSNGQVHSSTYHLQLNINKATECVFYKLGGNQWEYAHVVSGTYKNCIFVDSNIKYQASKMTGCVFYGNNTSWGDGDGGTSSMQMESVGNTCSVQNIFRNAETGTTYITLYGPIDSEAANHFAKKLGGNLVGFETESELRYVLEKLYNTMTGDSGIYLTTGITKKDGAFYDYHGNAMPWIAQYMEEYYGTLYYPNRDSYPQVCFYADYESSHIMVEIPGDIYITDIQLEEYVVDIDLETTYQINATLTPHTADEATLEYVSEDESIVTVDENGVITPVAAGTTNVRIYAPDYAVYNYVTVNVVEAVPLESLAVREGDFTMDINTEKQLHVVYNPTYTTRKNVMYSSSNEEVLTVSAKGVVTALAEGEAVITVTGENDISCEITVNVIIPVESVLFTEDVYATTLEQEDGTEFYPVITPSDATYKELVWESSNPEVCYVDESGNLVKLQAGTATLKASLPGTEFEDTVLVAVTLEELSVSVKMIKSQSSKQIALMEDGSMWIWGTENYPYPQQIPIENVKDFMWYNSYLYVLDNGGAVTRYNLSHYTSALSISIDSSFKPLTNIKALSSEIESKGRFFAITNDGMVWAWGQNNYGELGIGIVSDNVDQPTVVEIAESVVKVAYTNHSFKTGFLTEDGELYTAGGNIDRNPMPKVEFSDVLDIWTGGTSVGALVAETKDCFIEINSISYNTYNKKHEKENRNYNFYYIEEGKVFVKNYYGYQFENAGDYIQIKNIDNAVAVFDLQYNMYIQTEDGRFYALGNGSNYGLGNGNTEKSEVPVSVLFGLVENDLNLELETWSYEQGEDISYVIRDEFITLDYNTALIASDNYASITLTDGNSNMIPISKEIDLDKLVINPRTGMVSGEEYTLTVPQNALKERKGTYNAEIVLNFTYLPNEMTEDEVVEDDVIIEEVEEVIHETIVDTEKMNERHFWTSEEVLEYWNKFVTDGHNTKFHSNVILNRLNDDDVTQWLRFTANNGDGVNYQIGLGGNYWGTTNEDLINKQILDFDDYQSLYDILEGEILTEAPEDTFPFVVDAYLMLDEEVVDTVGNDLVTFVVEFNRDMDTSIPLEVKFGSAYPYADYEVGGEYVTPRQWKGEMQLTTIIENGYQYWSVSNGKAAGTFLKLYTDWGRFPFKIDTSSAQALIMQADVSETGIQLTWTQDDFDTLAGYNVYRSTEEDGLYTRLNRTVIPADTMEWFDDTVEPGQKYYYNFTVVDTDLTESEPSGKVQVTAMDTMAPNIYHSPVYHAFTGSNLVISATVTDNVSISEATLYYRIAGTDTWESKVMTNNNDKYSAVIPASMVTVAGVEYYIDATDGISHTLKGSQDAPYSVTVQVAVADSEKGDVDGNGAVELRDALMVLMAINDRLNLTEEQFARADLDGNGSLAAKEALRIMQYVNGSISSIL